MGLGENPNERLSTIGSDGILRSNGDLKDVEEQRGRQGVPE